MEKWPNFFVVGAPKAGTTSLHEYLKNILEIYMSPIKEPNYFSGATMPPNHPMNPIRDKKKYLELFKNVTNEKIIGESTATYLFDPIAPQLIHKIAPDAKILISLRDPVERAYSHYLMVKRNLSLDTTFKNEIKKAMESTIIDGYNSPDLVGGYTESINRYLEKFGKTQVKIIIFEEFVSNPIQTIQNILKFLGLNYENLNFEPEQHNPYFVDRGKFAQKIRTGKTLRPIVKNLLPSSLRKSLRTKFIIKKIPKPKMNQDDRDFLVKLYREDVQKVETLLGRKLPWPNFQN